MARRRGKAYFAPTITRTIERVGIAAIAAVATSAGNASIIGTAIIVFCVVAVVEELGRGFVLRGRRVSFWDVARDKDRKRRIQSSRSRRSRHSRKKRTEARARGGDPIAGTGDEGGGEIRL